MSSKDNDFFRYIVDKISLTEATKFSNSEYLKEVCNYFNISHGFIYEINFDGQFIKTDFFQADYAKELPEVLDLKGLLGYELLSELSSKPIVIYVEEKECLELEKTLNSAFNANVLLFIPILNQHYELAGFVGLCDRRKKIRNNDVDIYSASAILTLLSKSVKIDMFQKGISNTEKVLNNVLDHVGIDIYVNDYYTHDILYVNKSMAAPYGGVEEMIGKKCYESIFTDKIQQCEFCPQPKLLDETNKPNKTYTWDYEREMDGSWFRVLSSSFPWTDGRIAHLVASVDITENKKNQMLIEKLAQYDYLTGLPNRRSLNDDITMLIQNKIQFSPKWYVLFCDLDGFKNINDTLGHESGDVLLKTIAEKLRALANKTEDVRFYRLGGDEFVALVKDMECRDHLEEILTEVMLILCSNYIYNNKDMKCGCSVGIAHYPTNGTSHKDLFHCADVAMYAVKNAGKGDVRFCKGDKFLSFEEYFQKD